VTLRWGLLGTARINRRLIPAIRASARSRLVAVGSRDSARAAAYARDWDIPEAHAPYEALLAAPLDIVYIALPNSLHVPWTLAAVAAGRHVLCEKPLALRPEDVDAVITASRAAGLVVTEGFMYRHHAQTTAILETLVAGAIGEVQLVSSGFSYLRERASDVRLDRALGGGVLWDIGCYPVSVAQLIAGRPTRVAGVQRIGPTGVDEMFAGTLTYRSGVVAQVSASFGAAYQAFLRIVGTHGTIAVDHPFRPARTGHFRIERDDQVKSVTVTGNDLFVDEITDLEDAVLGIKPPRLALEDSRSHATTLAALHEAARTDRPVGLA